MRRARENMSFGQDVAFAAINSQPLWLLTLDNRSLPLPRESCRCGRAYGALSLTVELLATDRVSEQDSLSLVVFPEVNPLGSCI